MKDEERLEYLKNMVEADPENLHARFGLGRLQLEFRDFRGAEESFRKILEIDPGSCPAHLFLAGCLIEAGRSDEAADLLRKGIPLAHEKGEYQLRNQMQNRLRSLGIEPPDPLKEERLRRGIQEGEFSCARCGKANPKLDEPPFDSEIGKVILEKICQDCWREWIRYSVKVINEYRLNLATEQGSQVFDFHMKDFLGL